MLSGGDGDGTLGIKAIKERGGLTLAQVADGHGPSHPSMPDSAIAAGFVDFALPADEMGARLVEFARGLRLLDGMAGHRAGRDGAGAGRGAAGDLRHPAQPGRPRLRRLQDQDLPPPGAAAHAGRASSTRSRAMSSGCARTRRRSTALFRDLLISVTNFFRDADAFEALAATVVPKLFEGRGADEVVRVWVPGCATGEEVFSLAILLREHMDGLARRAARADLRHRHRRARARASRAPARYPGRAARQRLAGAARAVLHRRRRQLRGRPRRCATSASSRRTACIRDPPFSRIDLVSCRNLLIYFGPEVQNQVIPMFHYALRPGGYLFLGTSENISQFGDLFAPIEKKHRIFRRRAGRDAGVRLPMAARHACGPAQAARAGNAARRPASGLALRQAVESQVLERFAPPFVVVNREGDIVYYSARTGKYLEAAAGAADAADPDHGPQGPAPRPADRPARGGGDRPRRLARQRRGRGARTGGSSWSRSRSSRCATGMAASRCSSCCSTTRARRSSREEAPGRTPGSARTARCCGWKHELRETRERLQSLIEEYETALEELKSSNEELVSVNEELQSTNEELEASKEELQSVNEELQTVNLELSGKVEALDRANDDLQNLFDSTDVATVFLDRDLRDPQLHAGGDAGVQPPAQRPRAADHRPLQPLRPARSWPRHRRGAGRQRAGRAPPRPRGGAGPLPRAAGALPERRPAGGRRGGELRRRHWPDPGRGPPAHPDRRVAAPHAQPAERRAGHRHADAGQGRLRRRS